MYKKKHKSYKFIVVGLTLVMLFSGCKQGTQVVITTNFEKNEVFRINNTPCYLPELMLYLTTTENQYRDVYQTEILERDLNGETLNERLIDNVLAKLAQVKTMCMMAEEYNVSLSDEEVAYVKEIADVYYSSLNEAEIAYMGVTYDDVYGAYYDYVLAEALYEYIIRDINPEISDDEARTITVEWIYIKTYGLDGDENMVRYTDRAQNEAYALAKEVHDLAVAETDEFEVLAQEYTEDENITYSFGRGEMPEVIEEASFALDEGEISDVVETDVGYYIIRCVSTFDVEETQENKVQILKERKDKAFHETYDKFVEGLTSNLNRDLLDTIEPSMDEKVSTSTFFSLADNGV